MKAPQMHRLALSPALALVLAGAVLAGCGGGDSTGSTVTPTANGGATSTTTGAFVPSRHHDSGGGSAQFLVKGGDNSVQEFGRESDAAELKAAAAALHGFLDARAERSWATACSHLGKGTKEGLAQMTAASNQSEGGSCAAALAAASRRVPASTLAEAAQANVGSLREEGARAFLIYRGADNTVYAISMSKEGGAWKVVSLTGTPLG